MSLLTPPQTEHHRDSPVRLSGSRVAWAQQNQYFVLTHGVALPTAHQPRPSLEQPAKSILKKRDHAPLLPPQENQREVTPEPEDPLVDLTYLAGPLQRIVSPDSPLRDLIEAYSVLHARVRASVANATDADASWPLFQPLRKDTQAFTDAVVRDLGRALVVPTCEPSAEDELPADCDNDRTDEEPPSLLPSPKQSPKKKKQGVSATQVKFARDLCTTTHAVLRLLSAVFTMPPLYQIFDDAQLRDMLSHVLAVPMADELPTPNARKTCALSIWLLQVQRLPESVLLPARDRIAFALRRGMEGELGKEGKKGSACDGLKAVHDLSLHQPATFVPAFVELLPSILANLLAPTLGLRTQACHALGGFVLGSISLPCSSVHARISNIVATFLTTPPIVSPRKSPAKAGADSTIVRTLRTTLNTVDPQHVAQGPVWALSVLASLIVLLGPLLCTNIQLIRIISALLSLAMRNKKSSVRALASLLWRCIAWVYLRQPSEYYSEEDQGQEEGGSDADNQLVRESFWKLAKSVVDMGTGVSTVAALLGDDTDDEGRLRNALYLIGTMLGKGGQTTLDAIDIMKILVSGDRSAKCWSLNNLLPHSLFSSNPGLLTADYKTLSAAVKPIFDECPQLEDIRPLTCEQLSRDWVFREVIKIWRDSLGCLEIPENCPLPPEILETWNGLLKANITVLLDADDHDGIIEFASRTATILVDILHDLHLDLSLVASPMSKSESPSKSDKGMPVRSNSVMKLVAVRALWASMRTICPTNLLHAGGAKLAQHLVEDESDLVWDADRSDAAKEEWAKLCSESLVVCDVADLEKFWTRRLHSYASTTYEPAARRLVWGCFVETWTAEASWEGAITLLGVPFDNRSAWELSNDEFGTWDRFLKHAIDKASDNGMDAIAILDHVASLVARSSCPAFVSSTRVADILLSHCEMDDIREFPTNIFELVNDTLVSTYPPEPRNIKPSIWLLTSLTRAIDASPLGIRTGLLEAIQDGVSAWLSDEYRIFAQEEYMLDVLPLYQTALLSIQELSCTTKMLKALLPLIQSVFTGRDDKPPIITEAFADFWASTFADLEEPEGGWPEGLRTCLDPAKDSSETDDIEPSSDPEETDDDTACVPSPSVESEDEDFSPPSSPLRSRSDSRCSVETIRAFETSPVLEPALFNPVLLPSPATSRCSSATCITTAPSTPVSALRSSRATPPPRPQKPASTPESFQSLLLKAPAGTLPVYPTTPKTPRSAGRVRPSLSPGKSRSPEDKENASPLSTLYATEGYATPGKSKPASVLGKRQMNDESPGESATKKGRTTFIRSSIEFPSSGEGDLEDELAVEAALCSPTKKVHSEQSLPPREASSQSSTVSRKRKRQRTVMEAVVVPSLADVQHAQRARRRRASAESCSSSTSSPGLRRSSSMPKLRHFDSERDDMPSRQKRFKQWDGVDVSSSASLSALEGTVIAGSDDSIMLPDRSQKRDMEGSDDDPHLGQVSPRHLASPAPRRYLDDDPLSDDAPSSSPSRDLVARRQQRFGLLQTALPR